MANSATQKQIDLILSLGSQILGRQVHNLAQMRDILVNSHRNLTVSAASAEIDQLRDQLAKRKELEASPVITAPETGMDAETAVSLLGRVVRLENVPGMTIEGEVHGIELKKGTPALDIRSNGTYHSWRLHLITTWAVVD